ncbi:FtsK/SpoIIIE domain-containing protein [Streptomyces sp. AK02-01A]|uniref:FtsK/SpoIIIE domain-containing protein n=1 Tax=Streptomyces sp. AK02-01A TaxID=3028648 RepID=UPI0029BB70C2|nr:FtsK/SpoIIIE domain-containing protein [Streptomyces sp. AK02-01A]MDX3849054.1 FHA domain-containing protein [Streptomyces sp. AK02-01A]
MQIRLTVLAPRSGHGAGRVCDVLVTAPPGTALAAVASGLATAVSGSDASGSVVLYAGRERLDAQRCALGEPPLIDGAVLSLQVPGEDDAPAEDAPARLQVVAGPDAGGVHLLHGGQIRIGRSAEADVPLDDPDVSRLHCAVTVTEDGRVSVADLGSTNGTVLDGVPVGERPVPLLPGALLRLGESALRLTVGDRAPALPTAPDGEGHLRIGRPGAAPLPYPAETGAQHREAADPATGAGGSGHGPAGPRYAREPAPTHGGSASGARGAVDAESRAAQGPRTPGLQYGSSTPGSPPRVPDPRAADTHYGVRGSAAGSLDSGGGTHSRATAPGPADEAQPHTGGGPADDGAQPHSRTSGSHRQETAARESEPLDAAGRRRGIGAWARRLAGGRGEDVPEAVAGAPGPAGTGRAARPETWPDPAEVLLTALGPGPRLWERDNRHAETLVVRLGTADRPASDEAGPLPCAPVTVALREAGSLGLAGPRERLTGLARSVVAQLAALHSPADLEIVLISSDRARSLEQRRQDWGWLGWLPQVRPAHGQDCRLLLAYDREQSAARTAELTRRLDDGPLGPGWASAGAGLVAEAAAHHPGPYTVVIVDGDPGTAALRETTARLAAAGAAAGIHLLCLAETPAASALSPVAATYEAACAASLPFRECGAVALLSGDVATALRLLRTAVGQPSGHGTVAVVDAVSAAWAERFGRALAPLRTAAGSSPGRPVTALPQSSRLLDELGLARATPASLMARWASAADRTGHCTAVLGAGPRGPMSVDLTDEGPHLLIEGPAGSGRTELLRSVAASLAAAVRPDALGLLLVDGAGGERGEGLSVCTELPHVTEHLIASDPVRMREFAQALGAELKRRAEFLGRLDFTEWHSRQEVSERMIGQRTASAAEQRAGRRGESRTDQLRNDHLRGEGLGGDQPGGRRAGQLGEAETPAGGTLRLRATAARTGAAALPRLVVLVDDFDALVAPALGSPGRPAAGSVVRALEAVAREGERLGVHLVATSARPDRTVDTELAQAARLRVVLDAPPVAPAPDDPAPGRGRLGHPDGRVTPFQGGRVTGRIPRTATLRPTVVPLEWERMGDPPARRPVRELGNGPTDLALLASALERAARSVDAVPVAPLTPAHP